jgi:uncharacterized protein
MIWEFFSNKIILSVIIAYFIAGLIKIFFHYLGTNKIDLMIFFRTGGMPSSHTSSVCAMTTCVYLLEGFSNLFMVSFIISIIIISDAIGIRRAAGKQAQVLNTIVQEFTYFKKFKTQRLSELLGHTTKQVIAGILLGIFVANVVFRLF